MRQALEKSDSQLSIGTQKTAVLLFIRKEYIRDFILALVALCLTFPVIVMVGMILFTCYGKPVIYRERRMGLHGNPFILYKFKTLEQATGNIPGSQDMAGRINKNGPLKACNGRLRRLLRRYSIDELPQFWNILIGDMALVGPRPMPADELRYRFGSDASKILSVRPGLTGLWQVSGRNDLSLEERHRLDLFYVQNRSSKLDIQIMLKSVAAVLSGRGAY